MHTIVATLAGLFGLVLGFILGAIGGQRHGYHAAIKSLRTPGDVKGDTLWRHLARVRSEARPWKRIERG